MRSSITAGYMGKWEIHEKYKEFVGTVINLSVPENTSDKYQSTKGMRFKKKKSLNIQYLNRKTLLNKRMVCFTEL